MSDFENHCLLRGGSYLRHVFPDKKQHPHAHNTPAKNQNTSKRIDLPAKTDFGFNPPNDGASGWRFTTTRFL